MSTVISQHWTLDQEKLEAFILNKLNKKEMSLLAVHLDKCGECTERIREERELRAGIRRFGRLEMKRRLKLRLKRDQGRRFEWTYVASLAAAIVVVLGAVFTVRWFIDIGQEKEKVREIILTEKAESKPAERAMWIIGRVIEIKEEPGEVTISGEESRSHAFADNLKETQVPQLQNEMVAKEELPTKVDASSIKAPDVTILSDRPLVSKDVSNSVLKTEVSSSARSDSDIRAATPAATKEISRSIAQEKPESSVYYRSGASSSSQPKESRQPETGNTFGDISKGKTATPAQTDSGGLDKVSVNISDLKAQIPSYKPEKKSEASKPVPVLMAGNEFENKNQALARQKSLAAARKRHPARNIIVRRGDMKDLPASMRTLDLSTVQTKLERTPKGVLLTFYSAAIKDTSATFIEAVSADSIIVFFRGKQIAYRIPGGLSGGT